MTYALALAALADPTRRKLVERIGRRVSAAGELGAGLGISQPAVSQHLAVLRRARLVKSRRAGRRQIYRLDPKGAEALRAYVDRMWSEALDSFAKSFEGEETR